MYFLALLLWIQTPLAMAQESCSQALLASQYDASAYLNQRNPGLSDYFVMNGGLCGPTCLVNAKQLLKKAIDGSHTIHETHLIDEAKNLIDHLQEATQRQVRVGTSVDDLYLGLSHLFEVHDVAAEVSIIGTHRKPTPQGYLDGSQFDVLLLTLHNKPTTFDHWVVAVYDASKGELQVLDPSFPNQIYSLKQPFAISGGEVNFPADPSRPSVLSQPLFITAGIGIKIKTDL